jgi:hypothetical protein
MGKITTVSQRHIEQILTTGLSFRMMVNHIQPAIGFYTSFTSIDGDTTLMMIYNLIISREKEYVEYIRRHF